MRYRVEFTDSAEADADAAYSWIAERAPEAAVRWFEELERRVASLVSFPERCPLAPESAAFGQEIRHPIFGNYRLLFTVTGRVVYVLHVRHAARLPLSPEQ